MRAHRTWPSEFDQPVGPRSQPRGDRGQALPRVTQGKACPFRQFAVVGGTVAAKEAAGELRQRAVAVDVRLAPQPVAHEHERVGPADHRTAHDQPLRGSLSEQVHENLSGSRDAGAVQLRAQLLPRHRPTLRECSLDRRDAPLGLRGAHPQRSQPPRAGGAQRRRRQRLQPRQVLHAHEVQRAAAEPADHKRAIHRQRPVERLNGPGACACAHGEPDAPRVLALKREEMLGDGNRARGRGSTEQLRSLSRQKHGGFARRQADGDPVRHYL